MASLSPVLLVLLSFVALFFIPVYSTSRNKALVKNENDDLRTGFRVTLKHVDSGKNLTRFERVQRGVKRGRSRLQRLNAMILAATSSDDPTGKVEAPVFAGNGEYLMKLSVGTPPESFSAIMDTGSDLIWTQCKPCKECFNQKTPIFDPNKSKTFSKLPCTSNFCESLPSSKCNNGCEYFYSYGDYSSTQGVLATETFTFGSSENEMSVPKLGFGCGNDNEGDGFNQGSGLVGLGRGPLSLVSQLKEPKFSYCLTSIDNSESSSTLLMGSLANLNKTSNEKIKTTPLIKNPSQPSFYYLSLNGISVGTTRLPVEKSTFSLDDEGSGGVIIDSGTTITYLEESAFDSVKKAFIKETDLSVDESGSTGLDLCFNLPPGSTKVKVPRLTFHFEGADLVLEGENYMIGDSSLGVLCLAMGSSRGMSIFGNVQQQNLMVVHDLVKETISFVPTQCDKL